ncbi:FecR protein [Clostridium homopropionicum DSM 5847]|uniref:FecR protein n=1 Tax=Clostridium homopropionicum DSM 5847 TaxID=1121318 RepID=A0A0L6ZBU7_9CLOT|nr:FecR domain-containing protein [Clostridium homopropionicum]KOA20432.1 FecR protein [Clostridium homopropionicum DSM 5847]SFG34719.1 FecR family protein [Clostridium homopropionicum]
MKKTYKNIIKFFLLFSLIFNCFSVTAFAEASVATISSYKGSVYVKKSGGEKKISAFKGMRLKKGDTIITGKKSSATLDIDSDKEVTVGDNTQLSITELSKEISKNSSKSSFTLQAGKVWANVKTKLNKDSKFQIKTSTTIAGVRGTKFYVSQEEGQSEIAVLEGTVFAETYIPTAQPDGAPNIEKVEKVLEKDQHLKVDDTIQNKDDIIQQPLKLENLNSFVLESYKNSVTESDPELLNKLDKIIEEKKIEEDQKEKDKPNTENEPKTPPQISYDPVVAPEIPANNDTGYTPPPDPIPNSAPVAINLSISGDSKVGNTLTGMYTYSDRDNDIEGTSTFKWYRGSSVDGLDKAEIEDATSLNYTLTESDLDKYIFFEVTPIATTGFLKGQPVNCVLTAKVSSYDTTPPVGTILNSFLTSEDAIIIQFNESLHADTLAITTPSTLLLNSSIKIIDYETTEDVNVDEVQWSYSDNMSNNPFLALYLEHPISVYSQGTIEVQFNQDVIKDIYGNINNDVIIGKIIDDGNGYIPTISGIENLCENTLNSDEAILTITLGTEQGNWVEDIVSDTSKLNKLYDSFYTDSNYDQWSKLRDGFTATLVNDNTLDLTIAAEPNYNIDKNQWVILIIPGELVSSNLTVPSMPFVIHAQPAEQLTIDTEYSSPVPGTGGSSYGTTKIETLKNINDIPEATKWQVKVFDYNNYYYDTITYDRIIDGAIDYTQGEDIEALPYQDLLLLATDNEGKVKKYASIHLTPEMVSVLVPPVENLSFDNSNPEVKNVVIIGNDFPYYYEKLEVITTKSGIPSDTADAEYELYQLYQGTLPLTPFLADASTTSGDTVYYRFVNGQMKSPWVADGIVTYDEVKPKNSNSNAENIRFILSASEKKVKIKSIDGIFAAVIKNANMLSPVSIPENGSLDISIDDGIDSYDTIAVAILNEDGNISAKSDVVQVPSKMYNHIYYNRFTVLGNKGEISLNSNYKGSINIFINGTLITSSNIQKNYDTYIPIATGLASGDKIQVQLIDEFGNESELSDEVMVMDTPNINDIQLNFGTAENEDSITINNLESYEYYKITIVNSSNHEKCYELVLNPSDVPGTGPLIFSLGDINGTTGSTYKIYFSDFNGNTSPLSEIITAQ